MSEENQVEQGTEAPESGGQSPVDKGTLTARNDAKSEPSDTQATPKEGGEGEESGKQEAPEAKPEAKDKGKAKPEEDKKPEGDAPEPKFSPDDLEYAAKKGFDLNTPDGVAKLLKSYRSAEGDFHREEQAKKSREVLENARKAEEKPGAEEELTPLKEFQSVFDWRVSEACRLFGVQSLDELAMLDDPRAQNTARHLKENYPIWRQEAYEKEQEYKQQAEKKRQEQADQQRRFESDMRRAKDEAAKNLGDLRKEYPELDQHMKASGVNDFLQHLEDVATWPRDFTLSNPKIAKWVAKAAKAIDLLDHIEERKKEWQQEYEKSLKKAKGAQLPSGDTDSGKPDKASFGGAFGHPGHGVTLRD